MLGNSKSFFAVDLHDKYLFMTFNINLIRHSSQTIQNGSDKSIRVFFGVKLTWANFYR